VAEYALMLACGATACWALGQAFHVQLAAIIGLATVLAALAFCVDLAWRRRGGDRVGSA
jgi:hypothetical protein